MTRQRRHQKTVWVDGCRVLIRWSDTGRGGIKVTAPAGAYAREQAVGAYAVGRFAQLTAAQGVALNIGAMRIIRDHPEGAS